MTSYDIMIFALIGLALYLTFMVGRKVGRLHGEEKYKQLFDLNGDDK